MSRTISAKVSDDLLERIEEAQEEGESRSATVRRLVRTSLDEQDSPHRITLPVVLMWAGSVAVAAQYASASGAIGPAGLAALALGFLLTYDTVNERLTSVYDQFTSDGD